MTASNFADISLTNHVRHITTGRHTRQITALWKADPTFDGWTPLSVLEALARPGHPNHDQLVSGLVRRSQENDRDATVLLLAALRPGLWKLAHVYHRQRSDSAFDDLIVNAVHCIARADAEQDRLYDRIIGRVRSATPRRPEHDDRFEKLADDRVPSPGDLADQITARETLRRLGELQRESVISEVSWSDLAKVHIHGVPLSAVARGRSDQHVRADISRTRQKLQRLLAG